MPELTIYSFSLENFEEGRFVATRYPANFAVGGDWVCVASSDEDAMRQAKTAAVEEWAAPDTREPENFEVTFHDSVASAQ